MKIYLCGYMDRILKNVGGIVDSSKINKSLNVNYKIIGFKNVILNNYLIWINFKNIYYHLYKKYL